MPNKYQLVNEMANETLKEITQSGENWVNFLKTASNNYKYSFNEQVLIYAQNLMQQLVLILKHGIIDLKGG